MSDVTLALFKEYSELPSGSPQAELLRQVLSSIIVDLQGREDGQALYALLESPQFTGTPTATTQAKLNGSTALATTAYVDRATRINTGTTPNYFVRKDGSDSNDGSANSAAKAFLTIQKAVDVVCSLDMTIFGANIFVGDGTYAEAVTLKNYLGTGPVGITGNSTTPANCIISPATGTALTLASPCRYSIKGFKLVSTTGHGCSVSSGGFIAFVGLMEYGAVAAGFSQFLISLDGVVNPQANYTVSGNAGVHANVSFGGKFQISGGLTVTVSGTPAFSVGWYFVNRLGVVDGTPTFSGSATGPRINQATGGILNVGSSIANIPGSSNGSADGSGFVSCFPHYSATRVVTAAGTVTATVADDVIIVKKATGAATAVTLYSNPVTGQRITIKDGKADAATNNITITPASGNIDGGATYVISANYGSVTLLYNGTEWNVIGKV